MTSQKHAADSVSAASAATTAASSGLLASHGSTALFVLLWSTGAIAARWGLEYASAFAFLTLRFVLALAVLAAICLMRRQWLPAPGTRWRVAATGFLLIGVYTICYLLALDHGITPGVLATLLGVQPILTLLATERRFSPARIGGLLLALGGLAMVVAGSIAMARFSVTGLLFAFAALASMTGGAMLQKGISQEPAAVLPLQYAVALAACLVCVPFQPFAFKWSWGFALPLAWMALVISVGATLLFYRMIRSGNLVNVTSLFYLVPAGTAALDFLLLGNRLAPLALAGMGAILGGLALVFRSGPRAARR